MFQLSENHYNVNIILNFTLMNAKALLIPIAAFAVTVTGVQAYNSDILERAGLNDTQIAAFEEARELREEGDKDGARDILVGAGVDADTMSAIREAMHEERDAMHQAMEAALEDDDYDAFKEAIEGSPLADIITSEADFALFKEAHEHREAARDIMEELGFPEGERGMGMGGHHKGGFGMMGDHEGRGNFDQDDN